MTKYNISGDEIVISTEVENERNLLFSTEKLVEQAGNRFDSWYGKQYSCESLIRNIDEMWYQACQPLVEKGIEMLNAVGVYSLDEDIFMDRYIEGCVDDFFTVASNMQSKVGEVERQKQEEQLYRQQRKDNRGRVIGGGFGLGGSLKGMATAGVLNATTGMAHSIGNAVGNMGSSIVASSNKSSILKAAKEPLKEALLMSVWKVVGSIRRALDQEAGIKCRYVTDSERNTANAILSNYKQNRIPKGQRKEQLIKALQLNPYNLEAYYFIWEGYGDKNGELKKMAAYFMVGFETYLKNKAREYGDDLYRKVCGSYDTAWDKKERAIQIEDKIKSALDNMIQYCNKCEVSEDTMPAIEKCKNILYGVDLDLRTVRGVTYDTRELAKRIKNDYKIFYNALRGQDIFDDKVYEYIVAINYNTKEFTTVLPALFEAERKLRMPEKVYENFASIIKKNLCEESYDEWINISGYMGSLSEKEKMIYTITGMSAEEVVLILFDKSSNGKNGVLISNQYFRIYSKGIFSNESQAYPIEVIERIQSLSDDEYGLIISGQEPVKFNLKRRNINAEEQIKIANTINELIRILKNIQSESRQGLCRILKGVIRCECGINLLAGEKVCPSCKRILRENGEFAETEICPNCNNYILAGKKFCSICGFKLVEEAKEGYIRCPQCGEQMPREWSFCTKCGAKILCGN